MRAGRFSYRIFSAVGCGTKIASRASSRLCPELFPSARAQDFRSGQKFDDTVFFGENVDIHHIFPRDWRKNNNIKAEVYDSIINKTPLSYRTNRIIGGVAPSLYLSKLEKGNEHGLSLLLTRWTIGCISSTSNDVTTSSRK